MIKKIIFLFFFLVFIGCFKQVNPPKWLYSYPQNSNYLYASAQSYDKESAIKQALNNIASQLSVTLNSQTILNKGVFKNQYYKDFYQEINTKVESIEIPNYQIIKVSKDDIYTYVLVRVDKNKLRIYLKSKVNQLINRFKMKLLNSKSAFKKVKSGYFVLNNLIKIERYISILKILGEDISELSKKEKELFNLAIQYKNIPFKLIINDKRFKNIFYEIFSKYFIISSSKYFIKIKISTSNKYLLNQFIIKGKTNLNFNNEEFKSINFLGKSYTSYNYAFFEVKKNLKEKLDSIIKNILLKESND